MRSSKLRPTVSKLPKEPFFDIGFKGLVKSVDRGLIGLIVLLLSFGLIIIYDATVILSQEIYGISYRFVFLQFGWISLGTLGFYAFAILNLERLRKIATYVFFACIAILFLLALLGVLPCSLNFIFAPCINGANRWFYLNPPPLPQFPILGVLGFQPSELAKLSLIIFLAAVLEKKLKRTDEKVFSSYLIVTLCVTFLVFLQPNLSTATLIFMIGTAMFFSSGAKLRPLLISFPAFVLMGIVFMVTSSYRRTRLMTFLNFSSENTDLSTGYHIKQILIALGSGGLFGLGFGQSRQKFQYLPEVFADSIFAVIGEELGFIGTSILVILFALLIYKGYSIAKTSPDVFGKFLAVGVTTWIGLQFFVNVGAMTTLIPLTGIPLPLISYGGSSLVFMMMGLGLLANVSRRRS